MKFEISSVLREVQNNLSDIYRTKFKSKEIDKDQRKQLNYYEEYKVLTKFQTKCRSMLKSASDNVSELDRGVEYIWKLQKSVETSSLTQNKYIKEMMKMYNKLVGINFTESLGNIITNYESRIENKVLSDISNIIECLKEDPFQIAN